MSVPEGFSDSNLAAAKRWFLESIERERSALETVSATAEWDKAATIAGAIDQLRNLIARIDQEARRRSLAKEDYDA